MKWIIHLLFFIGFIGQKARGNNNDPAPGRSPGPPLNSELFSFEASHEAFRPAENNDVVSTTSTNNNNNHNQNRFTDIFSSVSREFHEDISGSSVSSSSDDDDNHHDDEIVKLEGIISADSASSRQIDKSNENFETNARLQRQNTDDESALNALKSSAPTLQSMKQSNNNNDSKSTNSINANRCNSLVKSGKIFNYVRLGEKVVKSDILQVDVTHDVFSTSTSLVAGIIYKGKVVSVMHSICSINHS
jgi:hypothetical protein